MTCRREVTENSAELSHRIGLRVNSPHYNGTIFKSYAWPLKDYNPSKNNKERVYTQTDEIFDIIRFGIKEVCNDPTKYSSMIQGVDPTDFKSMQKLTQEYNAYVNYQNLMINTKPPKARLANKELLRHIMNISYCNAISHPKNLNKYDGFSDTTYGETLFDMLMHIIDQLSRDHHTAITQKGTFIDLGSGVGEVVLVMAALGLFQSCIGIEIAEIPFNYSKELEKEFKYWMKFYEKHYADFTLIRGNFLDPSYEKLILKCNVIFANNFAWTPRTNHQLNTVFCKLRTGSIIVSAKSLCQTKTDINDRTYNDLGAIVKEVRQINSPNDEPSVSFRAKPVPYYKTVIDRRKLARYLRKRKLKDKTSPKSTIQGSLQPNQNVNRALVQRTKTVQLVNGNAFVILPNTEYRPRARTLTRSAAARLKQLEDDALDKSSPECKKIKPNEEPLQAFENEKDPLDLNQSEDEQPQPSEEKESPPLVMNEENDPKPEICQPKQVKSDDNASEEDIPILLRAKPAPTTSKRGGGGKRRRKTVYRANDEGSRQGQNSLVLEDRSFNDGELKTWLDDYDKATDNALDEHSGPTNLGDREGIIDVDSDSVFNQFEGVEHAAVDSPQDFANRSQRYVQAMHSKFEEFLSNQDVFVKDVKRNIERATRRGHALVNQYYDIYDEIQQISAQNKKCLEKMCSNVNVPPNFAAIEESLRTESQHTQNMKQRIHELSEEISHLENESLNDFSKVDSQIINVTKAEQFKNTLPENKRCAFNQLLNLVVGVEKDHQDVSNNTMACQALLKLSNPNYKPRVKVNEVQSLSKDELIAKVSELENKLARVHQVERREEEEEQPQPLVQRTPSQLQVTAPRVPDMKSRAAQLIASGMQECDCKRLSKSTNSLRRSRSLICTSTVGELMCTAIVHTFKSSNQPDNTFPSNNPPPRNSQPSNQPAHAFSQPEHTCHTSNQQSSQQTYASHNSRPPSATFVPNNPGPNGAPEHQTMNPSYIKLQPPEPIDTRIVSNPPAPVEGLAASLQACVLDPNREENDQWRQQVSQGMDHLIDFAAHVPTYTSTPRRSNRVTDYSVAVDVQGSDVITIYDSPPSSQHVDEIDFDSNGQPIDLPKTPSPTLSNDAHGCDSPSPQHWKNKYLY